MATVVFGVDWEQLAERGVGMVEGSTPRIGRLLRQAGFAAAGRVSTAARAAVSEVRERARGSASDTEDGWFEEHGDPDSEDSIATGPSLGAPGSIEVAVQEPELGDVGRIAIDRTDTHFDTAPPMDRDEPTAYAQRELVEVEIDPTVATEPPVEAPVEVEPSMDDLPSVFDAPDPLGVERTAPRVAEPEPVDEPEPVVVARPAPVARVAPRPSAPASEPSFSAPIEPGNLVSGGDDEDDSIIQWPDDPETVFELPSLALLDTHDRDVSVLDEEELRRMADALVEKLANFNIKGEVTAIRPGPVITVFEYLPAPGIKVSRIAGLADDIAMAMRALRVRIVAPIPGKGVVGIEIPNRRRQTVWYRDMLVSTEFRDKDWVLPMALGKTTTGHPFIADLAKMPHLLVGGTTGSGKSVGVNSMLMTLLFHRNPDDLKMILIDPKMLEFELYQDIPHLLHPVVTEPKLAAAALKWACTEMDERYRILARWGTRNIASFNRKVERELEDWNEQKARRYAPRKWPKDEPLPLPQKFPYIVIVIDELADLMMVASKEVEESIVRLAQKARACGIHLIVATQRPSVDVITGLIKANMPSRIAFQVRSRTDGRTILDQNGAEALLGKGDMLYLPPGVSGLQRLHGPFVADEEVQRVADFLRSQAEPSYDAEIRVEDEGGGGEIPEDEFDEFYDLAVQIVTEAGKASTSMIQRHLKIGYNRAARIIDCMEQEGVVGPADGARPRKVLVGAIEA
ncbi:MAG: DNA translocase FtsK [Alphaproteobacteria bacterium]|nr:DNA translocase FtsK [Alphaproteobacteria bacterium]